MNRVNHGARSENMCGYREGNAGAIITHTSLRDNGNHRRIRLLEVPRLIVSESTIRDRTKK